MKPRACLFDIGNVILRFDFQIAARAVSDRCPAGEEEIIPLLSPLADAFERGALLVEEFVAAATEKIGFTGKPEEFSRAFAEIFILHEPVAELIDSLAEEPIPLYLLSNTNEIHRRYFTSEWESIFARFDGAVYSHEVGHMKPEPQIYEIAIERFGLDPDQTLYIDDREENIVAGADFGLRTVQYDWRDHSPLMEAFR